MRYKLSDYEWTAIKPMLPNKPRGVRRVNDRRPSAEREEQTYERAQFTTGQAKRHSSAT
jgi:transposase